MDVAPLAAGAEGTGQVLLQLGGVLFGLGLLGLVAHRFRLSPVPLYLLAGLAFGEHGPLPLIDGAAGREFISVGAELGVVLLLLTLGLEYAPDELVAELRHNAPAGIVDLLLNALPGAALALLLGWGPVAAVALAGVTYISSSGIIAKALSDLGQLGNRETPAVIAVLVLEDLAMAAYLPVLAALLSGLGLLAAGASVVVALAAVIAVLVVALRFPGALARLVFAPNDEVLLLRVLGLALLVAGLAAQLNVSATVGAFLVGVSLSGPIAESAAELLRPLRDFFAAVFFVFFGLQIDPTQVPDVLALAVGLALLTAATKVGTGWWAAARIGIGRAGRIRAGVALIARGEFSIVIAGLATAASAAGTIDLDGGFAPLAGTYVLLLAVVGPLGMRALSGRSPHRTRQAAPVSGTRSPVSAGAPPSGAATPSGGSATMTNEPLRVGSAHGRRVAVARALRKHVTCAGTG